MPAWRCNQQSNALHIVARQELCSRSDVISKVTLCTSSQDKGCTRVAM
ncbi:hypothetical protein [Acinetobacter sp. COS3]|nr:hypothetical protein [Acinetobacter sp. COS3]